MKRPMIVTRAVEASLVVALGVTIAWAVRTPSPMLQWDIFPGELLTHLKGGQAFRAFTIPVDSGGVRIEVETVPSEPAIDPAVPSVTADTARYDLADGETPLEKEQRQQRRRCLRVLYHGEQVTSACNTQLSCWRYSAGPFIGIREITPEKFYVNLRSECFSACCDARGMIIDKHGQRLDDGAWDRFYLRAGELESWALALAGFLVLIRTAFRSRSIVLSILPSLLLLPALHSLWQNM